MVSSAIEQGAKMGSDTAGDLIARLEAATEGARNLDALIGAHIGYRGWTPQSWQEALDSGALWERLAAPEGCPNYTTSLDAALTLVPEGWALHMLYEPTAFHEALVWPPGEKSPTSAAKTLPLALCIAALKARAPAVSPESDQG